MSRKSLLPRPLINSFVFIAWLTLFGASSAQAKTIDEVAQSKGWLRLLHYKPNMYGKQRSLADGEPFFFAPDGNTDPKAELQATIEAFKKNIQVGRYKLHPQCAFPERFRFLKQELKLDIQSVPCPKFQEFLGKFKAQSVSLIFSSAYPNNPASMFGHTFLKINSQTSSDLLDFGINYAAVVSDDENPLAFAYFGIMGGYVGQFSMTPYYMKVNEYINAESRDLWEYELNMTPDETRRLLAHLWELEGNTYFDYFFFDENCSFQLLAAIEAIKTDWELTDFTIYVIPGESVKKVTETPGAIRAVRFRPSLQKKMFHRFGSLTNDEQEQFFDLIDQDLQLASVQSPKVLEGVSTFMQYKRQKQGNSLSPEDTKFQRDLLVRRSQLGGVVDDEKFTKVPMSEDTRPDLGHDSFRISLSGGVWGRANLNEAHVFEEFQIKSAYHDLLNKDLGYAQWSHIDFPGLTFRYDNRDKTFNLEKFTGIEITSLFPLTFIDKRISWQLNVGTYTPKDFGCDYCHVARSRLGGGVTFGLWNSRAVFYAMGLINYELGSSFQKGYRWGPGAEAAFLYRIHDNYKIKLLGNVVWDLFQEERLDRFHQVGLDQAWSLARNWDLRAAFMEILPPPGTAQKNYIESKLTLNHYFN